MQMKRLAIFWIFWCVALPTQAEIYKHVDASGAVSYTDYPVAGAKRLSIGTSGASWKPAHRSVHSRPAVVEPVSVPRIDTQTQSRRDNLRRSVLEGELQTERQSLEQARAARRQGETPQPGEQKTGAAYQSRLEKLDDAVKLHQDNVDALNRELRRIP